ncbi:MAG: hypothetical protein NT149_04165 [Candidatus Gottesmanbacteria bacterium]|nr:hypothetical protein [Candidatus Gottesmanbacteria bacterium]
MTKIEFTPSVTGFTQLLDTEMPAEGKKHHELIDIINTEEFQKAQNAADKGDIWATLNIVARIHPFKDTLNLEDKRDQQKRDLLILAAQQHEAENPEPTMRYATFIYSVRTAVTIKEILRSMPVEWVGKIPLKDPLPRSIK